MDKSRREVYNVGVLSLIRPFAGTPTITQEFGNDNPGIEPQGFLYPDGSIGYAGAGGKPGSWHNGIDYGLPCGTPLRAPGDSSTLFAGHDATGFGLCLILDLGNGYRSLFGHLTSIEARAGVTYKQGDEVAHSGGDNGDWRDGNSTGCHLHWSIVRVSDAHYLFPGLFLRSAPVQPQQPQRPGVVGGITFVEFTVRAQSDGLPVGAFDGPTVWLSRRDNLDVGQPYTCDAWMFGEPRFDHNAKQNDSRWYHLVSGGWVPSARVIGNAPGSKAT